MSETIHHLQIVLNPNGTITRLREDPHTSPSPDPTLSNNNVLTKDIPIHQSHTTFARLFLPRVALDPTPSRLPLILYFHGGGFVFFSASSTIFHDFCSNLANDVVAIVASIEYRLAPEHRLPAAYDDAIEALHWIKTHPDEWLTQHVDYSSCYLMGNSAGGNIVYHAGLREAVDRDRLKPLIIRGLILVQPFFGGTERCESEKRLDNDAVLPPVSCDLLWELSLPVGVDRDHEYCNPTVGDGPDEKLKNVKDGGWRVLVTGCDGDPLVDRHVAVVKSMKEMGVDVEDYFVEGGSHGIEVRDLVKQKSLFEVVKKFIASIGSS